MNCDQTRAACSLKPTVDNLCTGLLKVQNNIRKQQNETKYIYSGYMGR